MAFKVGFSIDKSPFINKNLNRLNKALERLGSGKRLNRASDDAAALAIAEQLKTQGQGFAVGIRNASDGISQLDIADSAADQIGQALTGKGDGQR